MLYRMRLEIINPDSPDGSVVAEKCIDTKPNNTEDDDERRRLIAHMMQSVINSAAKMSDDFANLLSFEIVMELFLFFLSEEIHSYRLLEKAEPGQYRNTLKPLTLAEDILNLYKRQMGITPDGRSEVSLADGA